MKHIEAKYVDYKDLIVEFTEEKIESRISFLLEQCRLFISRMNAEKIVIINENLITHVVLDYFSDISRLKKFHGISNVNEIKIYAYEAFWLLKRKPLQIVTNDIENDRLLFINEKFVLSLISEFLLFENINYPFVEEGEKSYKSFLDSLFYALKFRQIDAYSIELLILAFKAGQYVGNPK